MKRRRAASCFSILRRNARLTLRASSACSRSLPSTTTRARPGAAATATTSIAATGSRTTIWPPKAPAMPEKERPDHNEDVPVLTEMVEDEGQRRPAVDGPALEALARELERAVLERLGPEVDRVMEEKLAKNLNQVLGQGMESVRAEITVTMRQRSEEHTSELQSHSDLVCRLLLEKKKT